MNPLLQQFILEARDFLQSIGEKLMALENQPDSDELMTELFRLVHTLKGNSGLFDFPEMTRVLHAGEDLMDAVRDGQAAYSRELADRLLEAMDFIGLLLDEVEQTACIGAEHSAPSHALAQSLRVLLADARAQAAAAQQASANAVSNTSTDAPAETTPAPVEASEAAVLRVHLFDSMPETARMAAWREGGPDAPLVHVVYRPEEECFFKGEDPFYQAQHIPGLIWGSVSARAPWGDLKALDCYRCQLDFVALAVADSIEVTEFFRYTPEQVEITLLPKLALIVPQGDLDGGPVYSDFVTEALQLLKEGELDALRSAAQTLLELSAPTLWLSSALRWLVLLIETAPAQTAVIERLIGAFNTLQAPAWQATQAPETAATVPAPVALPVPAAPIDTPPPAEPTATLVLNEKERDWLQQILNAQTEILGLPDNVAWLPGRLRACAASLTVAVTYLGASATELQAALDDALAAHSGRPLAAWLQTVCAAHLADMTQTTQPEIPVVETPTAAVSTAAPLSTDATPSTAASERRSAVVTETNQNTLTQENRFGRRQEDVQSGKVLKVDQTKVDRLMNLIGEMVVVKNSLPYLANRAENLFGVRELSREIKVQYAVINRIAEEMQDAIMQIRMMPVSFVFQRFPRLVRDISRKLGKEVELVLEGEETEADKNIVESLADPLIHIVRNSLDHGLELPNERLAVGKSASGRLLIRALQESDRVIIEIVDDGRGIDPLKIKRKAYEKGLIDELQLERISDQDAINLVFSPGFSTADTISDLSGRGVGMDVVHNALYKVGGTVVLTSEVGKGTTLRLSLPLSMAVTNVMIVESDRQIFGISMDLVVETVRIPRNSIREIKRHKTTVLRGRIVPLVALNDLLAIDAEPKVNDENELAALVVRVGTEQVGLLVDQFSEVVDVILKPLPGELAKLTCYTGSALLGDGSVLMVLNPKELFYAH